MLKLKFLNKIKLNLDSKTKAPCIKKRKWIRKKMVKEVMELKSVYVMQKRNGKLRWLMQKMIQGDNFH